MVLIIILAYAIIGTIEVIGLLKHKQRKETMLYGFCMLLALVINTLVFIGVKITSPSKIIEQIVLGLIGKA